MAISYVSWLLCQKRMTVNIMAYRDIEPDDFNWPSKFCHLVLLNFSLILLGFYDWYYGPNVVFIRVYTRIGIKNDSKFLEIPARKIENNVGISFWIFLLWFSLLAQDKRAPEFSKIFLWFFTPFFINTYLAWK